MAPYALPGGIPGGLAQQEGKKPADFAAQQVSAGRKVEYEHTPDPTKATDIALDHLTEIPDYYTRLQAMEDQAKRDGKFHDVEGAGEEKKGDDALPLSSQRYAKLPYDDQPQPHNQPVQYQTDPDLNTVKQAVAYNRGVAAALYAVNLIS
jgi:hypothetical protein